MKYISISFKKHLTVLFFSSILCTSSCTKKPVVDVDSNYVGFWHSENYYNSNNPNYFFIDANSNGTYGRPAISGMESEYSWSGEVSIKKDFIFIKRHKLKIKQAPKHIDSIVIYSQFNPNGGAPINTYSTMKMVLSSGTFYKVLY